MTAGSPGPLAVGHLSPIGLAEVAEVADLQTRVDRKYLVDLGVVDRLVAEALAGARVLTIGDRTALAYESVYFDTPDLAAYRLAAHGRRRRFKVRTRTYLDSGYCVLEVKTRSGRGQTVKQRIDHDADAPRELDRAAVAFAEEVLGEGARAAELGPTLVTRYRRTTLVEAAVPQRVTLDTDLVCTSGEQDVRLDGLAVVEVKSAGRPTPADRWLWAHGHREVSISKYAVGLAALWPELPANRWNRTLAKVG
jgi:hypothetical protein